MRSELPLVVDLDGTVTPTDTLLESIILLFRRSPLSIILTPFWLLRGRAFFKEVVASRVAISAAALPYQHELLEYLRNERQQGRRIVLATAAHRVIADRVASHLQVFDAIIATEGGVNRKGDEKLIAIRELVGVDFVYAGDSYADLPLWKSAKAAVLVNVSKRTAKVARNSVRIEREFSGSRNTWTEWLRALRVHQWLKNTLLFVPILTAFQYADLDKWLTLVQAFFGFSLAASATYLANDLLDLESDRTHPRKRHRPFASGTIDIKYGVLFIISGLVAALFLSLVISSKFAAILLIYLAITFLYSVKLKEHVIMDVIVLAVLYSEALRRACSVA
jgi:hypothetical protein